jgi:hypothetical protein
MPTSPIMTVGAPMRMALAGPSARPGISITMTPIRQAITPLMRTVGLPSMTMPKPSGPEMLTMGQACWSIMARQAGRPPMRALTLPGPGASGMPWVVRSVMRAAGGILRPQDSQIIRYRIYEEKHLESFRTSPNGLDHKTVSK